MATRAFATLLTVGAMLVGCNFFRDLPDRAGDDYRIAMARKALDEMDFDTAISTIDPVWQVNPRNREVVYIASSARAGRAGLRILDLFNTLSSDSASKGVLQIFAEHFPQADDADVADMEDAVTILENYESLAADRDQQLNFYALFLYYSRIGVSLNRYAFTSSNVLNPAFTACHSNATTGLPNFVADRIGTTIPRVRDTIQNVVSAGGPFDALLNLSALPNTFTRDNVPPCQTGGQNTLNCVGARVLVSLGSADGGIGLGTGEGICMPPILP